MKKEDLFLAVGQVEESRLARSELSVSSGNEQEDKTMKVRPGRIMRTLLAAAIVVSLLAVTAYAAGFLIFESPEEMVAAIFGKDTGFDHLDTTTVENPWSPGYTWVQPGYDRVEPDPTVVEEDIAPYISPVGQSIEYHGMVLTVDAFVYDDATKCGVVTYTLENGPAYSLQPNGEIWYEGRPEVLYANQPGENYILRDKTTDNKLAAAFYFCCSQERYAQDGFFITLRDGMTTAERRDMYERAAEEIKASYAQEEMIAEAKAGMGEEGFETLVKESERKPEDVAFEFLRDTLVMDWSEDYEDMSEARIDFDCSASRTLKHIVLEEGAITVSPISIRLDITGMEMLHREIDGTYLVDTSSIDEIRIRFADGTEYLVRNDDMENTFYALASKASGANAPGNALLTCIFNRVIDLDEVAAVILNGEAFPTE